MWMHVFLCLLMFARVSGLGIFPQCVSIFNPFEPSEPEKGKNVPQIITMHGYRPEIHNVTTKDGYILQIHRVCLKNSPCSGKPILVQHGLLTSSVTWVWNTPDKNLPYILLKAGFDVWLGNLRGNEYGQNHLTLDPKTKEFWDFSWDEMAANDLPAIIDYILKINGGASLYLIGHSMGTTVPFATLSSMPEYNDKVALFVAIAPIVFVSNIKSPLKILATGNATVITLLNGILNGKLAAYNPVSSFLLGVACAISPLNCLACSSAFFAITGPDYVGMNHSRIDLYMNLSPSDCSVNTVKHYAQMINTKKFEKFDHGATENMKKYQQSTPPEYNIGNIKTKVAVMTAASDWMADPTDVQLLLPLLNNVMVWKYEVPEPKFAHQDFTVHANVVPLAYNSLLECLHNVSTGVM